MGLSPEQLIRSGFKMASHIAPGLAGRAAFKLFCRPMRSSALNPGEQRLAAKMAPILAKAQSHDVSYSDGHIRAYQWTATTAQSQGRVLLVHGWTGRSLVMTAFVQPLLDLGFDVITFDLPAHGDSSGRTLTLPMAARALQAVVAKFGAVSGVITHSFGGPVALLAAEGGVPLSHGVAMPRIVLISSPATMAMATTMFGTRMGLTPQAQSAMEAEVLRLAGRPIEAFRGDDFLQKISAQVLVIHDEDDADVAFSNAEVIATQPNVQLMKTKGLGHRRIIIAPRVVHAAAAFLADVSVGRATA